MAVLERFDRFFLEDLEGLGGGVSVDLEGFEGFCGFFESVSEDLEGIWKD